MIRVWLVLKNLVDIYVLLYVRFWGKMFGIEQNYYVVEVEYRDGDEEEEEEEEVNCNLVFEGMYYIERFSVSYLCIMVVLNWICYLI